MYILQTKLYYMSDVTVKYAIKDVFIIDVLHSEKILLFGQIGYFFFFKHGHHVDILVIW